MATFTGLCVQSRQSRAAYAPGVQGFALALKIEALLLASLAKAGPLPSRPVLDDEDFETPYNDQWGEDDD